MGENSYLHRRFFIDCLPMDHFDKSLETKLTDEPILLQKTAEGSREAFAVLYTYYTPLLYKLLFPLTNASKADTEEIIQDLFLRIWERREVLVSIQSFQAYVFRMARNMMVSQYRKRNVRNRLSVELARQSDQQSVQTTDDILYVEYHALAREAIDRLPPRQRQIFDLRTREDMSLGEIADLLGISLHAVKKQLYEAIRFVREWLRKHAGWLIAWFVWVGWFW